jgi:hypothetical protein
MNSTQRPLNLELSARTVLVTTATLRAVRGVDADTVTAWVEAGAYRWVFNVSAGDEGKRDLRFWAKEMIAPELCPADPAEAVAEILGTHSPRWRGTEVAQLLLISRPQVLDLRRCHALTGEIVGSTFHTTTAALTAFLLSRLVERQMVQ